MNAFIAYVKANWKTNIAAFLALAYSVPQFVSAVQTWQAGGKPDWRSAIISLIIAGGLSVAKDGDNHSTQRQVNVSTAQAAKDDHSTNVQVSVSAVPIAKDNAPAPPAPPAPPDPKVPLAGV